MNAPTPTLHTSTVVIPVVIKKDDHGIYVATSPLVKGLLVVSEDRDKLLMELVPAAMADLTRANLSS